MRSAPLAVAAAALLCVPPVTAQQDRPAILVEVSLPADLPAGPNSTSVAWSPKLQPLVEAGAALGPGEMVVEVERQGDIVLLYGIAARPTPAGDYTLPLRPAADLDTPFAFTDTGDAELLSLDGKPVWSFQRVYDPDRYEQTYKVYHHIHSPTDGEPLTKGAGGAFPHHRGVFCGWNRTQVEGSEGSLDFWHFQKGLHQRFVANVQRRAGPLRATCTAAIEWVDGEGQAIVLESRTLTAWNVPGQVFLDVQTVLRPAGEQVVHLRGDPQHAGLQFRASNEVHDSERKAHYRRPGSAHGGANDVWRDCPWVVADFSVRGQHYEVLHASHPDNPGPFVYSTRDYGRFGSFQSIDLQPGTPCHLRYRIVVAPTTLGEQVLPASALFDGLTRR